MDTIAIALLALAGLGLLGAWGLYRFTIRDPERTAPAEDGIVIAPADGTIKYVKRIEAGRIPYAEKNGKRVSITDSTKDFELSEGWLIGIWMSFLVVHIQRVPISGVVEAQRYYASGRFLDPHLQEGADYENERNIVAIRNEAFPAPILVVQIASIMVRRIVSFLEVTSSVTIGDRLGLIRMGSQVDIAIPHTETLNLTVAEGDKVRAGETVIARFS